jgi:glycosyltransferase involved in cell wall biosynthesis
LAKILIVTQFFSPETGAGARRIHALAESLAKHHKVVVTTLRPSYPSPQLFDEIDLERFDACSTLTVKRTFGFQPYSRTLILRGLREISMSFRLILHANSSPADVVLVTTPSMFLGPFGWLLAKMKRARFVWDVRDLTWRYGRESVDAGHFQAKITAMIEAWMRFILIRADFVVGATPGVSQLLIAEHCVPASKVATISNGVSRKLIAAFNAKVASTHTRPRVLYLGLLGNNHGIGILVDVARLLPDIDFIIVGDGPEKPIIEARIEELGVGNLSLQGYCTNENEMVAFYQDSDILFNHTKDRPVLNDTVMPFKNFEYMATGKPMVYAGKGLAVDLLDPIGCAEIAEPENPESIAAAIRRLLDNPERAREMGQRGKDFVVENGVREDLMEKFVAEIESRLH